MNLDKEGHQLLIKGEWKEMPHPILDARQVGRRIIVIYDYMDFPKWRQAHNLVAYDLNGNELWTAEHPTNTTADCYVNFLSESPLIVDNFAGYKCIINESSGRLIESRFTK